MSIYASEAMARAPQRPLIHPGEILREDTLPALKMSVSEAADKLGISRKHLHKILSEQAAISAEMAVRFGKLTGTGPGLWINLQGAYDVSKAEREIAAAVNKIPTVHDVAGTARALLEKHGRDHEKALATCDEYIAKVGRDQMRAIRWRRVREAIVDMAGGNRR